MTISPLSPLSPLSPRSPLSSPLQRQNRSFVEEAEAEGWLGRGTVKLPDRVRVSFIAEEDAMNTNGLVRLNAISISVYLIGRCLLLAIGYMDI